MGVIDVKNLRYSYGKLIVTSSNASGSGGITPEDMENIKQFVNLEVAQLIADHDISVNDTHNAEYGGAEYPDVTVFSSKDFQ